jgi:hypothetical protein
MHIDHARPRHSVVRRVIFSLGTSLAIGAIAAPAGVARPAVAPQNTAPPTISGTAREESTLTANNGNWNNAPTSFTYQWQRCDTGGASCTAITGATEKTYKVATADVEKRLRVVVTAVNADGQTPATSPPSALVSSAKGPTNTALPTISGTAQVGEELSTTTGTWTGGVQSYTYQWQRCDAAGASCGAISDATARVYGVRTIDTGNTLRVVVTARNASGSTSATSAQSAVVRGAGGGGVGVVVPGTNKAPTINFISLRKIGVRVYARFRTCDDGSRTIVLIARDTKRGVVPATHRFAIPPACGVRTKNWVLPGRFRQGRYTATLRAVDRSGKTSRTVSRSLTFR